MQEEAPIDSDQDQDKKMTEKTDLEIKKLQLETRDLESKILWFSKAVTGYGPIILAVGTILVLWLNNIFSNGNTLLANQKILLDLQIEKNKSYNDSLVNSSKKYNHENDSLRLNNDTLQERQKMLTTQMQIISEQFSNLAKSEPKKIQYLLARVDSLQKNNNKIQEQNKFNEMIVQSLKGDLEREKQSKKDAVRQEQVNCMDINNGYNAKISDLEKQLANCKTEKN